MAVRSKAAGAADRRDARWTLTYPALAGSLYVAASPESTYVLGCGAELQVKKVDARGKVVWSRLLGAPCFSGLARPISAGEDGVVIAVVATFAGKPGARVLRLDPAGTTVWERQVLGEVHDLGVATTRGKSAICFSPRTAVAFEGVTLVPGRTGYVMLELDRAGVRIGAHVVDPLYDSAAQCAYDQDRELWLTTSWSNDDQISIDGVTRSIARGTWALRLTGRPRFLPLYRTPSTLHTAFESGWAVLEHNTSLAFVDREGATRWRIAFPERGCSLYPDVIAASPTRLITSLGILCGQRGGSATFGDLTIEDRTQKGDNLGKRTVVVDLDPITMRAHMILALDDPPDETHYVASAGGIVAFGQFRERLGLGSDLTSGPPEYTCDSNLPPDAQTWNSYPTTSARCRSGYHLKTAYPAWPFLAALPLR